jgi:hypothetical protein
MESKKESITTPESEPSSFTERIMSAIHSSNVKVDWEEVGAVRLCQVRNRRRLSMPYPVAGDSLFTAMMINTAIIPNTFPKHNKDC